jgi:hypothetical protein
MVCLCARLTSYVIICYMTSAINASGILERVSSTERASSTMMTPAQFDASGKLCVEKLWGKYSGHMMNAHAGWPGQRQGYAGHHTRRRVATCGLGAGAHARGDGCGEPTCGSHPSRAFMHAPAMHNTHAAWPGVSHAALAALTRSPAWGQGNHGTQRSRATQRSAVSICSPTVSAAGQR